MMTDDFFLRNYPWINNMPPGAAFICANTTDENTGAGCAITPNDPNQFCTLVDGVQTCNETTMSNAKYSNPFPTVATCNDISTNASTGMVVAVV